MKRTYHITLLNQKFTLKSESDEKHVRSVSDYVNKKLFEIQEGTASVSSLKVALLAALNIADDFFKFKTLQKDKEQEAKKKIKEIAKFVDQLSEQA